jgi:hypothetical protein
MLLASSENHENSHASLHQNLIQHAEMKNLPSMDKEKSGLAQGWL